MGEWSMQHGAAWIGIVLGSIGVSVALGALGLPSPFLFGSLLVGATAALLRADKLDFPRAGRNFGLGVIGVAAGSMIGPEVVNTIAERPVAVVGGVVATLALSLLIGQILRFSPHVNASTAAFASIAGGASGVSAVAREMGADEAIVLSLQYLRVIFVLAMVPVIAAVYGAEGEAQVAADAWDKDGIAYTVVALALGLGSSRFLRFSASGLLVPLVCATALALSGYFASTNVPDVVLAAGYGATGLMVGLSFTRATVRQLVQLMPLALLQVVLGVVGCALIGLVFSSLADVSRLDGYLATTPGGLPAVTAIAIGSGASVGLVITMQLLRVFLALLMAPVVGAILRRRKSA
jgi:membrane AbrB-like protein